MTDDPRLPETSFLRRWSSRKLAASREPASPPRSIASAPVAPSGVPAPAAGAPAPAGTAEAANAALPPVESLTFDSDFAAFLKPKVDETLRREALRKLFSDPRFNVMDGLDVYIDDYTKFEPMTPEILAQLRHAKFLFDPPKTRVNAQGYVEDVPEEEASVVAGEAAPAGPGPGTGDGAAAADSEAGLSSRPQGDDAAADPLDTDRALPPMAIPAIPQSEKP